MRRLSRSPALQLLGLTVILLVAAWRMLSLGMADFFALNQPEHALEWRKDHPRALFRAGEKADLAGDDAQAIEMSRRALAANPLEGRAYRVLGRVAERQGDRAGAVSYFREAVRLSPRDIPTHVWLEGYYLSVGQPVEALRHIDMLLRIEPEKNWRQYTLLQKLSAFPPAHVALAAALAKRPAWREGLMARICPSELGSSALVAPLMNRVREQPGGLSEQELKVWLPCLEHDGRWGEAYLTWVSSLPPRQRLKLTNIFNGGFEDEPSGVGFDWVIGSDPSFQVERLDTEGAVGKSALRITFPEGKVQFNHVSQWLVLGPGSYTLGGRYRAEGLRSEQGLVWDLRCAEGNRELAKSPSVSGLTTWKRFDVPFEVPVRGCQGQRLQLTLPSDSGTAQRVGGRAWFDDLKITTRPRDGLSAG